MKGLPLRYASCGSSLDYYADGIDAAPSFPEPPYLGPRGIDNICVARAMHTGIEGVIPHSW